MANQRPPNWPSKQEGKSSGLNRDNNPPKPASPKPQSPKPASPKK